MPVIIILLDLGTAFGLIFSCDLLYSFGFYFDSCLVFACLFISLVTIFSSCKLVGWLFDMLVCVFLIPPFIPQYLSSNGIVITIGSYY